MSYKIWTTPGGSIDEFSYILSQLPHLLIAGCTGSGKSVLINNIMRTLLFQAPNEAQFILIDPKRVELSQYRDLPHTLSHDTEPKQIQRTLEFVCKIMDKRFKTMQKQGVKMSKEPHIYVIIDEYADLVIQNKKGTEKPLQRICALGRASNIHVILATQRPTRDIVNGVVKANMPYRVALKCSSSQESRNILEQKGAEDLPKYGECYFLNSSEIEHWEIPLYSDENIGKILAFWRGQK